MGAFQFAQGFAWVMVMLLPYRSEAHRTCPFQHIPPSCLTQQGLWIQLILVYWGIESPSCMELIPLAWAQSHYSNT